MRPASLVELLVVLAILTLLVGLVGPKMLGQRVVPKLRRRGPDQRSWRSRLSFQAGVERFPTDEEELDALVKKPASAMAGTVRT